jgi:hypothetical protein
MGYLPGSKTESIAGAKNYGKTMAANYESLIKMNTKEKKTCFMQWSSIYTTLRNYRVPVVFVAIIKFSL